MKYVRCGCILEPWQLGICRRTAMACQYGRHGCVDAQLSYLVLMSGNVRAYHFSQCIIARARQRVGVHFPTFYVKQLNSISKKLLDCKGIGALLGHACMLVSFVAGPWCLQAYVRAVSYTCFV